MARPEKVRLGELLVQQKLISEDQLRQALEEQKKSGRKLGRVLIDGKFVTEEGIALALSSQLRLPYVDLKHFTPRPS
jgi:MSHA biogenesis protein MshE